MVAHRRHRRRPLGHTAPRKRHHTAPQAPLPTPLGHRRSRPRRSCPPHAQPPRVPAWPHAAVAPAGSLAPRPRANAPSCKQSAARAQWRPPACRPRPFPPRTVPRLTRASPPPPPSESRLRHCPPRALASARCVRVRDPWTRGPCPLCAANEHKNDHATSDAIKHGALTSQQPRPARSLCQRLTSRCRGADRVAPRARTRPSCSRPAQTDPARAPGRGGGPGNATAHAGTHPAQGTPRDARRAPWQRPGPAPRSAERACRQRPRVGPACRDSASEESLNDR